MPNRLLPGGRWLLGKHAEYSFHFIVKLDVMLQLSRLGKEMARFASVGVLATVVGMGGMFATYNLLHWNYWLASGVSFAIGALLSFVLNRRFTFAHQGSWVGALLRFAVNVAICYTIAFALARPATLWCLRGLGTDLPLTYAENIALALGNVLYTAINYAGQKWFVFRVK